MKNKRKMIIILLVIVLVSLACTIDLGGDSGAEQTLEALYVEQTVEAMSRAQDAVDQSVEQTQQALEAQIQALADTQKTMEAQQTMDALALEEAQRVAAAQETADAEQAASAQQTMDAQAAIDAQQTADALLITPTPTATIQVVHTIFPSEPGWISQWWMDTNSKAWHHRIVQVVVILITSIY